MYRFLFGKSDQVRVTVKLCGEVQIWQLDDSKRQWVQQGEPLGGHTDWVRDVAWAPNLGMPMNTIASAGQDGKVIIWTEQSGKWNKLVCMAGHQFCKQCSSDKAGFMLHDFACKLLRFALPICRVHTAAIPDPVRKQQHDFACMQLLHEFGQAVWKLSWSVTGGILAVSDSKGTVSLWKEAVDGQWQQISQDVAAA